MFFFIFWLVEITLKYFQTAFSVIFLPERNLIRLLLLMLQQKTGEKQDF